MLICLPKEKFPSSKTFEQQSPRPVHSPIALKKSPSDCQMDRNTQGWPSLGCYLISNSCFLSPYKHFVTLWQRPLAPRQHFISCLLSLFLISSCPHQAEPVVPHRSPVPAPVNELYNTLSRSHFYLLLPALLSSLPKPSKLTYGILLR